MRSVAVPSSTVQIQADGRVLEGDLQLPEGARRLVLFAHGSGSSRLSPRNRAVAAFLNAHGLGTLLFDLLTAEEARDRRKVFDIELLASRLVAATDHVRELAPLAELGRGYFGASTGAAAALIAAAERPKEVDAVVAAHRIPEVRAPALLIVGGVDVEVLRLNRSALALFGAPAELAVVPGASHLFEEPGTLEQVAELAASWFTHPGDLAAAAAELP